MTDDLSLDTSPTVEPAAAAPPGRSRLAVVMLVAAGLLLVGGAVFAVLAFQAQSTASNERDVAAAAVHRRTQLAADRRVVTREAKRVEKFTALGHAMDDLATAQDHFVEVVNHGADLYNQGDDAGATAVYRTDAVQALDNLEAKHAAAVQALHDAVDSITQLEEAVR